MNGRTGKVRRHDALLFGMAPKIRLTGKRTNRKTHGNETMTDAEIIWRQLNCLPTLNRYRFGTAKAINILGTASRDLEAEGDNPPIGFHAVQADRATAAEATPAPDPRHK